ncbi:MAG: hypothetical protein QXQ49_01530 [Archaeoglobaceae archaeon]
MIKTKIGGALKIISEVYGIPILVLEELLSDLIDQIKVLKTIKST